ncbi:hypothetical protein [Streptomyces olivaceus]
MSEQDMAGVEGWVTRSLGSLASRVTQRNLADDRNVLTISAKFGLVSQEEFFNRRVASADLSQYFRLHRGDFAYNKSYSAGYPAGVVRQLDLYDSGVVSPLYICFRVDPEVADADFVSYYFDSGLLNDAILNIAKEGVRNHGLLNVRVEDFFALELHLPTLEKQRQIVKIIEAAEGEIEALGAVLEKVRLERAALVRDLIPVSPEPTKIPDWEILALRDVVPSADYGISSPLTDDARGTPVLRMNNIHEGKPALQELKYSDEKIPTRLLLQAGDVLFNRTNSLERVGKSCVWTEELRGASFASYLIRLNFDRTRVHPAYLVEWLEHDLIRRRVRRLATPGAQQVNVNPTSLRGMDIELPSLEVQGRIVDSMQAIDYLQQCTAVKQEKLKVQQKALMDDLLTGRVRVPVGAER